MEQQNQSIDNVTNLEPVVNKQNNFLVILLSVLLLLSVSIVGFFAYQTQKLVKELTMLKTEQKVVDTSEPIIEPVATGSSEADLTANWKTYINTSSNYQIRYPSDWETINYGLMEAKPADSNTKIVRFSYQPDISKSDIGFNIEETPAVNISQDIKFDESKNIGSRIATCGTSADGMNTFCWLQVPSESKVLVLTMSNYKNTEDLKIVDQILSTFKFIN